MLFRSHGSTSSSVEIAPLECVDHSQLNASRDRGRPSHPIYSGSPKETPPAMRFAAVPDIPRPFLGVKRENVPPHPPLRRAPYCLRATGDGREGGSGVQNAAYTMK